jgi:hypothetical protein
MTLFVSCLCSSIITYFGEQVHNMNRDIRTYIYAVEGFIIMLVLLSLVFLDCSIKFN